MFYIQTCIFNISRIVIQKFDGDLNTEFGETISKFAVWRIDVVNRLFLAGNLADFSRPI